MRSFFVLTLLPGLCLCGCDSAVKKPQPSKDAKMSFRVALMAEAINEYETAIKAYSSAITLSPDWAEAYYNRGGVYSLPQIGSYDLAIRDYQRAIEIDPKMYQACYNCGNAFLQTKDYENAIAMYNKALSVRRNYAKAYNQLAVTYHMKGDLNSAITTLKQALASDLDDQRVSVLLESNLEMFQRDHEKASRKVAERQSDKALPKGRVSTIEEEDLDHLAASPVRLIVEADKAMGKAVSEAKINTVLDVLSTRFTEKKAAITLVIRALHADLRKKGIEIGAKEFLDLIELTTRDPKARADSFLETATYCAQAIQEETAERRGVTAGQR
jgi:Flp pilus assembly protein TadD